MDIVYIRDLRIDTFIGIYDWEQQVRQTLSIDLEMATDVAATAAANEFSTTLDYKAISDRLLELIENQHFELLESLAEQIAQLLQDEFKVGWLRLRLGKPGAVPAAADVGVLIERGSVS
ncbi:MAG: dihydroneopterin aldolase [Gammaproteobacteria bacterium]|nr:dihydroneopterin aldolase [Gammaproteobacteria bacterium]